jgi:hypothetical protein
VLSLLDKVRLWKKEEVGKWSDEVEDSIGQSSLNLDGQVRHAFLSQPASGLCLTVSSPPYPASSRVIFALFRSPSPRSCPSTASASVCVCVCVCRRVSSPTSPPHLVTVPQSS